MKRKIITTLLSLSVAGTIVFTPATTFAASDDTTQVSKTDSNTEKSEDADEKKIEDLTIKTDTQEVIIKNQSGHTLTVESLKESNESDDNDKNAPKKEASVKKVLTITDDDTKHVFENIEPDSWTDPIIYDEYGFLYIKYQDAEKKDQEIAEIADEKELDTPLTVYLLSNVNVREKADEESKSLKVLSMGTELKAIAIAPEWIKIESDDLTGYIYHSYITENKETADAKVKEEKEAKEKAAAQAAQEQAAQEQEAAASASSYDETDDSTYQETDDSYSETEEQEVYEVSRQQYDDCDGSGHGYYEITYSDGSVSYEEY